MNKISLSVIVSLIISIVLCVLMPVLGFVFSKIKYKKIAKPFFLGALAFFISQIALRLPILQIILPKFSWYGAFSVNHPVLYCLFLGLSAGVFEETARFIFLKGFFKKGLRFGDGIAFGIGHGGIEVILITVISLINTLVCVFAINNGTLNSLMASSPQAQIDSTSMALYNLSELSIFMGVVERISAMAMHIGMTMIIVVGINKSKSFLYLLAAIFVHCIIDTLCGILPMLGINGWLLEGVLAIFAIALIAYTVFAKKHNFDEKGVKL
ncbi:MAG: YhfC family glutamic-type intramembrane protease [Oscillospiraceae bacterium]